MPDFEHIYDVVIVGGGPAGISCALECHESGLDVVVLERAERVGGQLSLIPGPIYNYAAGFFESGETMRNELEKVAQLFLTDRIKTGCSVVSMNLAQKEIVTDTGVFRGKTVFLATGYRLKEFDLPIPNNFADDVLYRSGIYRESLKGKPIAIVGSGDSAVFTALDLAEYCSHVTVLARGETFKARPDIVAQMKNHNVIEAHTSSVVIRLRGQESLESVIAVNEKREFEIKCTKLIAKLGYLPNTDLFADQLQNARGHITVDQNFSTSIKGVFAAGDIVHPGYDRIAFAAGSGMMAARSIRVFLGHTP
ncbi:MAG: NAD(P)/FAD-dependent oxidoreductase [Candidatus Melainabacteria bacterium]|nr:NAD(P)/FAD-dependent oxidoreductase [Candidatus Melainabacteria bacterium]